MSQQRARLAVLGAILLALAPRAARATQKFGPIQLSGNLQTANIVRTPDQNTYEYIMNRNTAHVRFDYDWLQSGKFYNKYDIPFLESSHLSVIWRGVYDSIYDTTPGFIQKEDNHGRAYGGLDVFDFAKLKGGAGFARSALTVSGLSRRDRDALKFDNQLREAYADIKLRNIPLTVRAGRQQIVWGESDDFRMLDRANTLDLTWHFTQEIPPPAYGWDEIRPALLYPTDERHEALRARGLLAESARQQPGRRALPRHRAVRARVRAGLLLPALRGRRRHRLRPDQGPAEHHREPCPGPQPAEEGHLPGEVLRALHPLRRRLGQLLRGDVHPDRFPGRDALRLGPALLRSLEGDNNRQPGAAWHYLEVNWVWNARICQPE